MKNQVDNGQDNDYRAKYDDEVAFERGANQVNIIRKNVRCGIRHIIF